MCIIIFKGWGPWSNWSPCSRPCGPGPGSQIRTRRCLSVPCSGPPVESRPCIGPPGLCKYNPSKLSVNQDTSLEVCVCVCVYVYYI